MIVKYWNNKMNLSFCNCIWFLSILSGIGVTCAEDTNTDNSPDSANKNARVYNGTPVNPPHSRPYIAQRLWPRTISKHVSGCVIYDEWTLFTLPDEMWDDMSVGETIMAGKYYVKQKEDSQQERKICLGSEHPKQNDGYAFRGGVIHLSVPLKFDAFVQPAVFAKHESEISTTDCKLTGWGRITKGDKWEQVNELREGPTHILPPENCKFQSPGSLCISGGACRGDEGAALTCKNKSGVDLVVGIGVNERNCSKQTAITLMKMHPGWLEDIFAEASKKCREQYGALNGNPVVPHSRPYVVQIHTTSSKQVSIGVLINAYTIVTSAHKLKDVLKVTAGKHLFGKYEGTQQTRSPCHISQHPSFDKPANAFGYGLIHLSDPFVLNEYVNGISIAPKGAIPKEKCSIIAWQGNSADNVLRKQLVKFKDAWNCTNKHQTSSCVNEAACLHDWGSPVVCLYDSKIYLQAIVGSANAYCKDEILVSIPELPRDWLATELRNAEAKCGKSTL